MAFRGNVALVFGGGSGMGQLWAQRLADQGAEVAIADVSEKGMAETARGRSNIQTFVCDVASPERVREVVAEVEAKLGSIERVIHAAAIMPGKLALEDDIARVRRVMQINFEGTVNVVQTVLPKMLERNEGDLICFGSVAGYAPTPEMSAYCASKAAVNSYVETVAWENRGTSVRIHLVCPFMTDTPLLEQAKGAHRMTRLFQRAFQQGIVAKPGDVIDAVEAALERGDVVSTPNAMAKAIVVARRISPKLLWEVILRS